MKKVILVITMFLISIVGINASIDVDCGNGNSRCRENDLQDEFDQQGEIDSNQDEEIENKADKDYVDSENQEQNNKISKKANKKYVDRKNKKQNTKIKSNSNDINGLNSRLLSQEALDDDGIGEGGLSRYLTGYNSFFDLYNNFLEYIQETFVTKQELELTNQRLDYLLELQTGRNQYSYKSERLGKDILEDHNGFRYHCESDKTFCIIEELN
jgi:hypothetical protein